MDFLLGEYVASTVGRDNQVCPCFYLTVTKALRYRKEGKGSKILCKYDAYSFWSVFFFNFLKLINYFLFLFFFAVLGLRFCARALSSCGKRGPLFIAVRGPLTVAASLVAEHRLQTRRLSSCGSRA